MARTRPTSVFKYPPKLRRVNFSGSHNDYHRHDNYTLTALQQTIDGLSANAGIFPSPPYDPIAQMQAQYDILTSKVQTMGVKGNRGSHAQLVSLQDARKVADQMLADTAAYVQAIASGTGPAASFIQQTFTELLGGFAVRKKGRNNVSNTQLTKISSLIPAAPQNLRAPFAKKPLSGSVKISWQKVRNAAGYNVYAITIVNGIPHIDMIATTSSASYVASLPAGSSVTYFVKTIGANGYTSGSSPLLKVFGTF